MREPELDRLMADMATTAAWPVAAAGLTATEPRLLRPSASKMEPRADQAQQWLRGSAVQWGWCAGAQEGAQAAPCPAGSQCPDRL